MSADRNERQRERAVAVDLKTVNITYWNQRAEGYARINHDQFGSERRVEWLSALEEPLRAAFPELQPSEVRVLDVGCGPGLFSLLLALQGYRVTGADYTPNMLARARENTVKHGCSIDFVEADAEHLPFADEAFHAVVSRNLTWNLPHPREAYAEWARVLKPGGVLVNFDANWYRHLFYEDARQAYEADRMRTREAGIEEECEIAGFEDMEAIARQVPLSLEERPGWDVRVLRELGMRPEVDAGIWRRVWNDDEQVNFASTPLFRIVAKK